METTSYRAWEKRRQEKSGGQRMAGRRHAAGSVALGPREKRRLVQLGVCVVLFLTVFIGKGIFPGQVEDVRAQILQVIRTDTDFKAAFSDLGRSISAGEPVLDTLGELWVDVFGNGTVEVPYTVTPASYPLAEAQAAFFLSYPRQQSLAEHWLGAAMVVPDETAQKVPAQTEVPVTPAAQPEPTPAPLPAVEQMAYTGPALPENATMDKYNLGAVGVLETASPVIGWVASSFGWREHPVDGGEKFHNGVDLAVNDGTEVLAFADGVVDYIGDNPDVYGKYFKISHAGGVSTFYAHCSQLLVSQGQTVKAGQVVARSGETGNATGPHLHFEIKLDGTLINPLYYIETT